MNIGDIMTPKVVAVDGDLTTEEAAKKMKGLDIGALAVKTGYSISGLLTDRDIVIRAIAAGKDTRITKIKDIMSPNPIVCRHDQDIEEAAKLFAEHRVRRLLVTNESDELVGLVSLGDLAVEAEDSELVQDVMKAISEAGREKWFAKRQSAPEATAHTPVS